MTRKQFVEAAKCRGVAFELEQGGQIRTHLVPVDQATGLYDDALRVEPVLRPILKNLEHDQRAGCHKLQSDAGNDLLGTRRSDRLVLERQRAQRYIQRSSPLGLSTTVPARKMALHLDQAGRPFPRGICGQHAPQLQHVERGFGGLRGRLRRELRESQRFKSAPGLLPCCDKFPLPRFRECRRAHRRSLAQAVQSRWIRSSANKPLPNPTCGALACTR